jgi:Holliday junction resolvase-like predicted endonuclease
MSNLPKGLMIYEDDVVLHTAQFIKYVGWDILQQLTSTEQGFDIIAEKNGIKLYVEAKGGTSKSKTSNRYGVPFNPNQAKDHIRKALGKVAEAITQDPTCQIALALPYEKDHYDYSLKIAEALKRLKISIFWVTEDGQVKVDPFFLSDG